MKKFNEVNFNILILASLIFTLQMKIQREDIDNEKFEWEKCR